MNITIENEDESVFFSSGFKRGLSDFNLKKPYNPSGHSIKITSLKSYGYMVDNETGYISAFKT